MLENISFDWTITIGQVISTSIILVVITVAYMLWAMRYSRVRRRVDTLEAQVAFLRNEVDKLLKSFKAGQAI